MSEEHKTYSEKKNTIIMITVTKGLLFLNVKNVGKTVKTNDSKYNNTHARIVNT